MASEPSPPGLLSRLRLRGGVEQPGEPNLAGRLLVFVPHPDDEAYAFGGLIATLTDAGWRCRVVCASSGERGKRHDGGPPGEDVLRAAREAELAASCAILGAEPPVLWRLPDGELASLPSQAGRVADEIRRFEPARILCLGKDGAYGHPDHIALYRWVVEGWEMARRPGLLTPAAFRRGLFIPQWERCRTMMGEPPSPRAEELGGRCPRYESTSARPRHGSWRRSRRTGPSFLAATRARSSRLALWRRCWRRNGTGAIDRSSVDRDEFTRR